MPKQPRRPPPPPPRPARPVPTPTRPTRPTRPAPAAPAATVTATATATVTTGPPRRGKAPPPPPPVAAQPEPPQEEIYEFRIGFPCGVPAQVVGECLAELHEIHGADLPPAAVLEYARPADSPLHNAGFTWDVNEAAYQYNLLQARRLSISIRVRQADGSLSRKFVSLRVKDGVHRGGRSTMKAVEVVLADDEMAEQLLYNVLRRYRNVMDDARHIHVLAEFHGVLQEILDKYDIDNI